MDEQPDLDTPGDVVGARVTAAVITMRAERLNASFEAERARLRDRADNATLSAAAASTNRESEQLERRNAEQERDAAREDLNAFRTAAARDARLRDKRWIGRFGYAAIALLILASLLLPNPIWLLVSAIGLLVYWNAVSKWSSDPDLPWIRLVPAALIEFAGLILAMAGVLGR